jgi:hypothetical protein
VAYAHLLTDADPAVARLALSQLKLTSRAEGPHGVDDDAECMWHGVFLERANELLARGVSAPDRKTLELIHARIPIAPPLAAAVASPGPKDKKAPPASPKIKKLLAAMEARARLRQAEAEEKELPAGAIQAVPAGTLLTAGFADAVVIDAAGQVRVAQPDGTPGKKALGTVEAATRSVEAEMAAMQALVDLANEAAKIMTAIEKKRAGKNFDAEDMTARVTRHEKLLEIFIGTDQDCLMVRRESGGVYAWRGIGANPGAKVAGSLDDVILELNGQLRAVERKS